MNRDYSNWQSNTPLLQQRECLFTFTRVQGKKTELKSGQRWKDGNAESAELKHEQAEMSPQEVSDNEFE